MIGCLADHLHLRMELHSNTTFIELFNRFMWEYNSASEHRDFGWLPSVIDGDLAETYFSFISADSTKTFTHFENSKSLTIEPLPVSVTTKRQRAEIERTLPFRFGATVHASASSLSVIFTHDERLIERERTKRVAYDFLFLLKAALDKPQYRVAAFFKS